MIETAYMWLRPCPETHTHVQFLPISFLDIAVEIVDAMIQIIELVDFQSLVLNASGTFKDKFT